MEFDLYFRETFILRRYIKIKRIQLLILEGFILIVLYTDCRHNNKIIIRLKQVYLTELFCLYEFVTSKKILSYLVFNFSEFLYCISVLFLMLR